MKSDPKFSDLVQHDQNIGGQKKLQVFISQNMSRPRQF